jgi:hypothetical protein
VAPKPLREVGNDDFGSADRQPVDEDQNLHEAGRPAGTGERSIVRRTPAFVTRS